MIPFLLAKLGKEAYGLIGIMGSVLTFGGLAELGLKSALERHLAAELARGSVGVASELISTALIVWLTLLVPMAIALACSAEWLADVFRVSDAMGAEAVWLFRWFTPASLILSALSGVFGASVIAENRFDYINYIGILRSVVAAVAVFSVLGLTSVGLKGWACCTLGAHGIAVLALIWLDRQVAPALRVDLRLWSWFSARRLLRLGLSMCVIQLSAMISVQSDPVVLGSILGPGAVALYTAGASLVRKVTPAVGVLVSQLFPVATKLHALGDALTLRRVLVRGSRLVMIVAIALFAPLIAFATPVCRFWLEKSLGSEYQMVAAVVTLIALAELLQYTSGTQWGVLVGMNRTGFVATVNAGAAMVNIALSIFLVRFTSWGVLGVIIPTLILRAVVRPLVTWHTARTLGVPMREYLRMAYVGPLLASVVLLLSGWGLVRYADPDSVGSIAVCAILYGCLACFVLWTVGLNGRDRRELGEVLAKCGRCVVGRRGAYKA